MINKRAFQEEEITLGREVKGREEEEEAEEKIDSGISERY